jgi:23S rRNA (guanosine2251-2'-O)-methyltransferase
MADQAGLSERLAPLRPRGVALVPRDGAGVYDFDAEGTLILMLGAEGPGLSAALLAAADQRVTIPVAAPVESLNATVAAAVVLFELARRRRAG